jgi:hypothetical protein
VLGAAALFTFMRTQPATQPAVHILGGYSPQRFIHGYLWTLPGSAFLLQSPRMIGPTSFFVVLFFVPYTLIRGLRNAGLTSMAGHCAATLLVATVVVPGALLGWHQATIIANRYDVGASAALAATAGALSIAIFRRWKIAGAVMFGLLFQFFLRGLLFGHGGGHGLTDVEHLTALAIGALVEWRMPHTSRARSTQPATTPTG